MGKFPVIMGGNDGNTSFDAMEIMSDSTILAGGSSSAHSFLQRNFYVPFVAAFNSDGSI